MACAGRGAPKDEPLDEGWKKLTLREKIGETVMMRGDSLVASNETDEDVAAYLKKFPVGGVFDGGSVINDVGPNANQIGGRITRLRKASRLPLIVAGDMECGAGANVAGLTRITHLPGIGATRSIAFAYDFAKATAIESRSMGFNWVFTPVADLVQNPFNYIVADRSMSDDPRVALPLLVSAVHGYQENGLAATAKHFPGDGVDYRNQHQTTSCNGLTRSAWGKNHGAVFKALIDDGVMAIMAGHISLPCYQSETEKVDGRYLPATLSHDLTTKLLKEKMGFKGVVVSDALIMGGFTKFYNDDACVRSVAAGTDVLLWPPEQYFDEMEKAIQENRVTMARLDDAVQRVWRLKQKLGLLNSSAPATRPISDSEKEFIQKTTQDIAEKSITLVRDRNKLLPLNSANIHHAAIIPISGKGKRVIGAAKHLQALLLARGIDSTIRQGLWLEEASRVAAENDLLVYLVGEIGFQTWDDSKAQSDTWTYAMAGRDKTVVVSLDNPFHSDEFASSDVYINAYDASDAVLAALTRGLFGEIAFTGRSPVDLTMFRKFDLDSRATK